MKTSELSGAALDWAVARCEGLPKAVNSSWFDGPVIVCGFEQEVLHSQHRKGQEWKAYQPSTDWSQGGPIIEREDISLIRLDNESIPDAKGFWQRKYISQWGAVIKDRHSPEEQYGSQGDHWGESYHVDSDAIRGETPLIAAMRCYVASKLGDTVDIPAELRGDV